MGRSKKDVKAKCPRCNKKITYVWIEGVAANSKRAISSLAIFPYFTAIGKSKALVVGDCPECDDLISQCPHCKEFNSTGSLSQSEQCKCGQTYSVVSHKSVAD